MECTLSEAVRITGLSESTLRRRLRRGVVKGRRRRTPQGFTWLVTLDNPPNGHAQANTNVAGYSGTDSDLVAFLQAQLIEKDHQLGQALALVVELQHRALPAPRRPWWRFGR